MFGIGIGGIYSCGISGIYIIIYSCAFTGNESAIGTKHKYLVGSGAGVGTTGPTSRPPRIAVTMVNMVQQL